MALIKCPECGEKISDKSKQCIHCGYPLDEDSLDESGSFSVVLDAPIENRIEAIKQVRILLNMDLRPAMNIVDGIPSILKSDVSIKEAKRIKEDFNAIGAHTTIRKYEPTDSNGKVSNKRVCCPHCGSDQIVTGARGFSLLTGFLGSNKTVNRCAKCGWNWSPRG